MISHSVMSRNQSRGWEDGSMGKNARCASVQTWVCPHKSWTWLHTLDVQPQHQELVDPKAREKPYLRGGNNKNETFDVFLPLSVCTWVHTAVYACADTYIDHIYIYRKSLVLLVPHRYYVSLLVSLLFLVSHLFSFSWSVFITALSLTNTVPMRASLPFLYPLLKRSFIRMLLP